MNRRLLLLVTCVVVVGAALLFFGRSRDEEPAPMPQSSSIVSPAPSARTAHATDAACTPELAKSHKLDAGVAHLRTYQPPNPRGIPLDALLVARHDDARYFATFQDSSAHEAPGEVVVSGEHGQLVAVADGLGRIVEVVVLERGCPPPSLDEPLSSLVRVDHEPFVPESLRPAHGMVLVPLGGARRMRGVRVSAAAKDDGSVDMEIVVDAREGGVVGEAPAILTRQRAGDLVSLGAPLAARYRIARVVARTADVAGWVELDPR